MFKERCRRLADRIWYGEPHFLRYLLLPLSTLFSVVAKSRRAYLIRRHPSPVGLPVVIVGNLVVGGTGKTPLVAAIADRLKAEGYKPGIVSRGHGARRRHYPYQVRANDANEAGDEAVLLKEKTGCPVIIDPDRERAARHLCERSDVNIVICDDGLQHYRLHRNVEIALVDGATGFGNGLPLPAGPLREPRSRLDSVDIVVINGHYESHDEAIDGLPANKRFSMQIRPLGFQNLVTNVRLPVDGFSGRTVHGCAGIAGPQRFFSQLRTLGARVIEHIYPDHHRYREPDIRFNSHTPVIVTEKDAVKCRRFANDKVWVLRVEAVPGKGFWRALNQCLPATSRK